MGPQLMILAEALRAANFVQQVRFNKRRRSVYGLSFDYTLFLWISCCCTVLSSANYAWNSTLKGQYALRYPHNRAMALQLPLLAVHFGGLVAVSGLCYQCWRLYYPSRNSNQGLSTLAKQTLSLLGAFFAATIYLFVCGRYTVNTLDVTNCVWLVGQVLACVALFPQLFMNWFDGCVAGTHRTFMWFSAASLSTLAVSKVALLSSDEDVWHRQPPGYNTWAFLVFNSVLIAFLEVQMELLYKGNKPALGLAEHTERLD